MSKDNLENLCEFQHIYNPAHFYCRLIDIGLDQKYAKRMAEIYELGIYQEIMEEICPGNTGEQKVNLKKRF